MFDSDILKEQIKSSPTISSQSQIIAEWNLNTFDNIKLLGNYRYRHSASPTEENFGIVATTFDENDTLRAYTDATNSDIVVDGGYNEDGVPLVFLSQERKFQFLYSLEQCFYKFRPRSGINKILYSNNKYFNISGREMFRRPRYYMSSPDDVFKYWTSYRKENKNKVTVIQEENNQPNSAEPSARIDISRKYISNIKIYSVSNAFGDNYSRILFTTQNNHNFVTKQVVKIKNNVQRDYDFLPEMYQILEVPSPTTFIVSGSEDLYQNTLENPDFADLASEDGRDLPAPISSTDFTKVFAHAFQSSEEFGLSYDYIKEEERVNAIDDACPFVVYQNSIPANRIVVKMQTNVGTIDLGPFRNETESFNDPFFGDSNKTVPSNWRIEYLDSENNWLTLQGYGQDLLMDETFVAADGYLELAYGLIVPPEYLEKFIYAGTKLTESSLPSQAIDGYAYLIRAENEKGTFYIWSDEKEGGAGYESFEPNYGWQKESDQPTRLTNYVTNLVNSEYYLEDDEKFYRDIQYINGLRIVVEEMNTLSSTFDLIELSPRLTVDITERVSSVEITKGVGEVGKNGLIINGLIASNGNLNIFDYDNAFGEYNPDSILNIKNNDEEILYNVGSRNLQVKTYDIMYDEDGISYHVPIKILYADGFPESDERNRSVSIKLRDLFTYFESVTATEALYSQATLSFIVASLLDSVGFSNYIFKRINDKDDPIVPYFYVQPNTSVAEVLESIALSTQTAIFLDEYNNLVFMSKEYLMPEEGDRETDFTLYGSADSQRSENGIVRNERNNNELQSIVSLSHRDEEIYNDGKITFSSRSILRQFSSIDQANKRDSEKTWKYQNVLLWEIAPEAALKPINDEDGNSSGYTLSAIPLKSDLTIEAPYVSKYGKILKATYITADKNIKYYTDDVSELQKDQRISVSSFGSNSSLNVTDAIIKSINLLEKTFIVESPPRLVDYMKKTYPGQAERDFVPLLGNAPYCFAIQNNTMDFGEGAAWMSRYSGYFYAGAEVIRYDAIEFSISGIGKVWIESPREYKNYFSKMSFGGKIYPTGRVRIFSEPKYKDEKIVSGPVAKHGRGQFGTDLAEHPAGLDSYWTNASNKGAFLVSTMNYVFNSSTSVPKTDKTGKAGVINVLVKNKKEADYHPSTTGIIKNNLAPNNVSESTLNNNNLVNGTVQSSALVLSGPSFTSSDNPINFFSYVHKTLDKSYNHFGARLRIIGEPPSGSGKTQNPVGATLQTTKTINGKQAKAVGSSAGIAIMQDKTGHLGYYFEIIALTDSSLLSFSGATQIYNIFFYKVEKEKRDPNYPAQTPGTKAIAIPMWQGKTAINVDDGQFAGQFRVTGEELPSVYDIAVSYENLPKQNGKERLEFTLYLNGKRIGTVIDSDPIQSRANSMAPFVRGKTKAMFENIYALSTRPDTDAAEPIDNPVNQVFGYDKEPGNDALLKYGVSGIIKKTHLSGLSTSGAPRYNLYLEEFGTLMREMAYHNVKYEKAYPALYAQLLPTFNLYQDFIVSGFVASPYGAKFLIFNATDTILNLNLEGSSSYLRIGGVSFTSQSDEELSVDQYFAKNADLSEPKIDPNGGISNLKAKADFANLKNSRLMYGKKDFNLSAAYIQSQDAAEEMMGWLISKMMLPRKSIGVKIFANPLLQLGDIINISYKDSSNHDVVAKETDRFIIYHIEYRRDISGPQMTVYLSEVV
jgi:hypothetical protein